MSEPIVLDYYYGLETEQYTFFRIPKILFSPAYKTLSVSAKMLYALMLDRMSLAARNRWMDEDGRVYIYFRMSEIMSTLGCGHNKAIALYLLIQSFEPGEITPEEATELGYQLAMEFTDGQHQFVVATHTDRDHIHCHIEVNSTTLDCTHKFNNYKNTHRTIQKINDRLCAEHSLPVISEPKEKGQHYAEWANERKGTSWKAALRNTIDRILPTVRTFDDFLAAMRREGYEVRQDGKYLKFRAVGAGQERYTRAKTLGADYTEEALRARVGKPPIHTKSRTGRTADPAKINLIVDIQSRLRGRGAGYERWLKIHNLKEAAKTLTYLTEHGITEYAALEKLVTEQTEKRNAAVTTIRQYERRMERLAELRTHIVNYAKTHDVYLQYRKLPAVPTPSLRCSISTMPTAASLTFPAILPTSSKMAAPHD